MSGDIRYSVFSKSKGEKIDVDVTSGKMLGGGVRYNIKNNGKRIGFVELADIENGVYVEMLRNLEQSSYSGIGYLADLIAVEHCLKKGLRNFEILSQASFSSHALHYKRGKRFFDEKINKIVEDIIKKTPEGKPYNTSFLGSVPMYMPKALINKYIAVLSK